MILKLSLSFCLSPPPEQIQCCRSRCEALQFPAHAPKPWRQETALYWGKTPLSPLTPAPSPCGLIHTYMYLHANIIRTVRAKEEVFPYLHSNADSDNSEAV